MSKNEITPEVRRFVLTSIPSVPHMEALMLLWSTAPQPWEAPEVARRLYVTAPTAQDVLRDLVKAGIVAGKADGSAAWYDPGTHALSAVVGQLALFYRSHLVEITTLIHARLDRKAQQFAEAFNFRKDS